METVALIVCFSLLVPKYGKAFVLEPASSSRPVLHFDQLLDLLLDEKHSRLQLEQQLQDVANEQRQQNNRTVVELETFQRALEKEKSNRYHLEHAYTRLTIDFHNLSLSHEALVKANEKLEMKSKDLDMKIQNMTIDYETLKKKYDESLKLNADLNLNIKNLSVEMVHEKQMLTNTENDIIALNQSVNDAFTAVQTDVRMNQADIATNDAKISRSLTETAANNASIVAIRSDLAGLKIQQGFKSGFTATVPKVGLANTTVTFTNIISNIGNHFNPVSGKFTCAYPGLYFFCLTLYQSYTNHETEFWIRKNGINVHRTAATSGLENGYYEGSNSVFLHLIKGDAIDLHSKFASSTMDMLTTLTGFLVSSD